MKINNLRASIGLRPYISRYWSWQDESELPPLLPGSGGELFFFYQHPATLFRSDLHQSSPQASLLLLPRNHIFRFQPNRAVSFIAVRFRTGALRHFSSLPECELIDTCTSAGDIWGTEGNMVEQQISETPHLTGRIQIIEQFLSAQLLRHRKPQCWLDTVTQQFYYQQLHYRQPSVSLSDLIEHYSLSSRHFQRMFKQNFGLSPKHFQRIIRVEAVTRHLLLNRQKNYLDAALAHGYYDQSHFIKDWRDVIGETPTHFFQEDNFRSHFYNPPLSD